MLRIKDSTPKVYYNQSRDFQFIGRLYDLVLNMVKTNADFIYNIPINDNVNTKLLDLMSSTLGFKMSHNYNNKQLKAICMSFAEIIRNKGNLKAIEKACNAVVGAEGLTDAIWVDTSQFEKQKLLIFVPLDFENTLLIKDLMDYILPAGLSYSIIKNIKLETGATTLVDTANTIEPRELKNYQSAVLVNKGDELRIPDNTYRLEVINSDDPEWKFGNEDIYYQYDSDNMDDLGMSVEDNYIKGKLYNTMVIDHIANNEEQ